jgi:uncharacterized protein (DUF433 family)
VLHPGRLSGAPTIGDSRLPAQLVASTYYHHGADEVKLMWDYLTDADILVCCWYVANYGTRSERRRWKGWAPKADWMLWSEETMAECPWPPTKGSGNE